MKKNKYSKSIQKIFKNKKLKSKLISIDKSICNSLLKKIHNRYFNSEGNIENLAFAYKIVKNFNPNNKNLKYLITDSNGKIYKNSYDLKSLLKRVMTNTFNAITVDSDTSTNDMVAIFSSNKVRTGKIYNVLDPKLKDFEMALQRLLLNLAKQIVSDGEGAKKFITVKVINARSQQMARTVAFSIANSPLFKTAMAGEDPNWGRIIMAIGKSGEKVSPEKIEIKFGNLKVAEKGKISEEYNEEKLKEYMQWDSLTVEVNLRLGQGSFECYTCDLTNDYVKINADYRN